MWGMRMIPLHDNKKRGCQYCMNKQSARFDGQLRSGCPFMECPYHVLDKYDSYEEFMESEDSKILVAEFFTTVAGCYELAKCSQSPKRVFSDGDDKMHL